MAYATINKPSAYFSNKLYTGNGGTQSITGVGHQPDMTWIKQRNGTPDHYLFDAVRAVRNYITPNLTTQQQANVSSLTAFNSNGFTLGSTAAVNANNGTFASWNWKANGSGSSNTAGDIAATVSVNTTSGFSIVKWTGVSSYTRATIGHGLGKVPKMIMVKNLSNGGTDWGVYHASLGNTKNMRLNLNDAVATSSAFWDNTSPTSTLFTTGNNAIVNGGNPCIAYCFADIQGFSKIGSYVGNGNADGTFVYTGFKPAFVMFKKSSGTDNWRIIDNKRLGYNPNNAFLFPNITQAESNLTRIDLVSNGFKLRTTDAGDNGNGQTYIYMAFAEAPLVGTNNIPATAR